MGRHVAPRRRGIVPTGWFGRGRTRALLSLGLLLTLGVVGTSAYWTDTATLTGGTITSGSMDLQLQTASGAGAVGTGTGHTESGIAISNLTPSESYAFPVTVRNVGNADFTYTATVSRGGTPAWTFVNDPIQVQFFVGNAIVDDTTYPIQKTCSGAAIGSPATVAAGSTAVIATARRVGAGATDPLCLKVTMVTAADNANQGKQGQLQFDLTAVQVTT